RRDIRRCFRRNVYRRRGDAVDSQTGSALLLQRYRQQKIETPICAGQLCDMQRRQRKGAAELLERDWKFRWRRNSIFLHSRKRSAGDEWAGGFGAHPYGGDFACRCAAGISLFQADEDKGLSASVDEQPVS